MHIYIVAIAAVIDSYLSSIFTMAFSVKIAFGERALGFFPDANDYGIKNPRQLFGGPFHSNCINKQITS